MFGGFPVFFLLGISSLILLWSENTLCVISVLSNVLSFVLWPRIWPILVYVPWALGKKWVLFGQDVWQTLIRSCLWRVVEFWVLADFLSGCSSLIERGMLPSPTRIVDLPFSPFRSTSFCFAVSWLCCLMRIQESRVFLVGWLFYRYMCPSVSCSFLCPVLPVSIDLMQYGPFRFLLDNVCMVCLMPPSSFSLPRRRLGFLLDSTEQVTGCSCRSRSVFSAHRHLCLVYMSGLAPAIFYLFSVCSLSSHFSVPFLLPVCGFLEQFLEFYFGLSVIFFSIFPCIAFLVVSLDISYLPLCLLTLFSSWCNCLISSTLDSGINFASIVKHNLENSRGQEGLRYLDLFLSASFFLPSWCSAFLPREVPVTIS